MSYDIDEATRAPSKPRESDQALIDRTREIAFRKLTEAPDMTEFWFDVVELGDRLQRAQRSE